MSEPEMRGVVTTADGKEIEVSAVEIHHVSTCPPGCHAVPKEITFSFSHDAFIEATNQLGASLKKAADAMRAFSAALPHEVKPNRAARRLAKRRKGKR